MGRDRTRSSLRLAATLLACCALGLAFISTATAKRDHPKKTAGAQAAPAETSPAAGQTSTEPASTGSSGEAEAAAGGQEPEAAEEASAPQLAPGAQARHRKEGKEGGKTKRPREGGHKGKGKTGKGEGGGSGEGEGEEHEAAGEPTPKPVPVAPTVTQPTAVAASLTSSPQAPASTQQPPAPAVGTAPAVADSRAARAPRHAVRTRRHRAAGSSHGAVAAFAAAGATSAGATAAHAAAISTARRPLTASHAAKAYGRPSPIVNTITRIVDVVPAGIRVLIGALLALALALAVRSRFAALRSRRLERQRTQLLEDVGLLQAALLPVPPARLGPVGTSVAYQPAAGPGAGGDFYDVFALEDGQLAVIVGDVSGHGRQALPHTALVRFTLRAYLEAGMSPREAIQTAGTVLERQLGGVFATVVVATYNPRERTLVYSCAGHPPPVVLGIPSGLVTVAGAPPIGVGMRTGTRQTVVSVPGRAQICFHTDGVTEARVGTQLFGTERLVHTLQQLGPDASASALLARVAVLADAQPDDMAACLLDVHGDAAGRDGDPPTVLVEEVELDRHEAVSNRTERFLLACGVPPHEVAEVMRGAADAATSGAAGGPGRADGTAVLQIRHTGRLARATLQRQQVAHLHAHRTRTEVAL